MFDDDAGGALELAHAVQGGVRVRDVVIRQRLTLHLPRPGQRPRGRLALAVKRRALMRVLAIAQVLHLVKLHSQRAPVALHIARAARAQIVGNGAVVGRGVLEGARGQIAAQRRRHAARVVAQRLKHPRIVLAAGEHTDPGVVLGRRAQHARAADVDGLDRRGELAVGIGDRRLEGVQIDYEQIDGRDAVFGHQRIVAAAAPEQRAVNLRMQRLDPPVHNLGKARVRGDFGNAQTRVHQPAISASRREQFDALLRQGRGEFDDSALVRDTQQRAAQRRAGLGTHACARRLATPFSRSFLRRVPRFSPSMCAARV